MSIYILTWAAPGGSNEPLELGQKKKLYIIFLLFDPFRIKF